MRQTQEQNLQGHAGIDDASYLGARSLDGTDSGLNVAAAELAGGNFQGCQLVLVHGAFRAAFRDQEGIAQPAQPQFEDVVDGSRSAGCQRFGQAQALHGSAAQRL